MSGDILDHTLREVFGHRAFRGPQRQIVEHVAGGGDALVLMPTGGGKSLCYQVPALVRPGTALVVSPLIALMQDQVAALRQAGVRAAYLNSSLDAAEAQSVERRLIRGELQLLYMAPERLTTPRCLALLDDVRLSLIAIDEAHCVSQWGHDFRPEYLQLPLLHQRHPEVPRIALTATADPQTRAEILERLEMQAARVFVSSFDRPNIRYSIVDKDDARGQLLSFIDAGQRGQAGIVYCLSRKRVEEVAAWLVRQGIHALPYHAGMAADIRAEHQRRFQHEDGIVMVATIAFGMGIDKPDVRYVAHLDLPRSVEGYYQETGRAGRDGEPAQAWMAYGLGDVVQQRRLIEQGEADDAHKRLSNAKLDALLGLCESAQCRRVQLLAYFGENSGPCGNCDNCLSPPRTWDATTAARQALSAVFRTGQRFGAAHVIDVLRGADSEKLRRWEHDALSVFGIGRELDAAHWRNVFRQLVALGYLRVDHDAYGALRLTERARPVLKGEVGVQMRSLIRGDRAQRRRGKTRHATGSGGQSSATALAEASPAAQRLARLKQWRLDEARRQGVPAYVIFHDATLTEVALGEARTLDELAGIAGIGRNKLMRYGRQLLDTLATDGSVRES